MNKSNSIAEKCKVSLQPIIEELGYELVDIDYEKKQTGNNLTVYINSEAGISLDDCEKVHKAIDEPLDQLNPTNDSQYILNVSSLGLDWAFRSDKDYQRNIGNIVDVSLFAPIEKSKNISGELIEFSSETVTIKTNKSLEIPRKQIAKICKHVEF